MFQKKLHNFEEKWELTLSSINSKVYIYHYKKTIMCIILLDIIEKIVSNIYDNPISTHTIGKIASTLLTSYKSLV
jgi:hypothetical protein